MCETKKGGHMATFRGDGGKLLTEAIREQDLRRKVDLMEQGLLLHFRELEQVLQNLGIENFNALAFKELAKEVKACMDLRR